MHVLVEGCVDVGVWRLARTPTAAELDMVRVPVLTRDQTLLGVPGASLGVHLFLGLLAYDDSRGPFLLRLRPNTPALHRWGREEALASVECV